MTILTKQVAASTDDCVVRLLSGAWDIDLTNVGQSVGYITSTNYKVGGGLRFLNVAIPVGAIITTAYLILTARVADALTTVNSVIIGEKTATPATFGTVANYQGRRGNSQGAVGWDAGNPTTAYVNWDGIDAWEVNAKYASPEIKTIIQEIIGLPTWLGDGTDDIVIFWDDHANRSTQTASTRRQAYSYNDTPAKAAQLYIEYVVPTPVADGDLIGIAIIRKS